MSLRDLKNNLAVMQSLAPAARTASANGASKDLQGQRGAMVVFHLGAYTNGAFTPGVEESDDDSAFTAVAAADLEGSLTLVDHADEDNTEQRVGYKGSKRYIRAVVAEGSSPAPGTGMVLGASIITEPLIKAAA